MRINMGHSKIYHAAQQGNATNGKMDSNFWINVGSTGRCSPSGDRYLPFCTERSLNNDDIHAKDVGTYS
jgi:hypothetical protein